MNTKQPYEKDTLVDKTKERCKECGDPLTKKEITNNSDVCDDCKPDNDFYPDGDY